MGQRAGQLVARGTGGLESGTLLGVITSTTPVAGWKRFLSGDGGRKRLLHAVEPPASSLYGGHRSLP